MVIVSLTAVGSGIDCQLWEFNSSELVAGLVDAVVVAVETEAQEERAVTKIVIKVAVCKRKAKKTSRQKHGRLVKQLSWSELKKRKRKKKKKKKRKLISFKSLNKGKCVIKWNEFISIYKH